MESYHTRNHCAVVNTFWIVFFKDQENENVKNTIVCLCTYFDFNFAWFASFRRTPPGCVLRSFYHFHGNLDASFDRINCCLYGSLLIMLLVIVDISQPSCCHVGFPDSFDFEYLIWLAWFIELSKELIKHSDYFLSFLHHYLIEIRNITEQHSDITLVCADFIVILSWIQFLSDESWQENCKGVLHFLCSLW